MNVEPGKLVYTQWLNPQGGIEADVTVAKMADDVFFVTTGVASTYRDYWYLKKNLRGDVKLVETTSKYACLSIQGPNSRAVLTEIAETDMSVEGFKFGTGRFAKVGGHDVWIQRLSYVGELGWEVFAPSEYAIAVFAEMQKAGAS